MIKFGFFDSVEGDRTYSASDISEMYEGVLTNGIVRGVGEELKVNVAEGLKISIGTGKAVVDGKWIKNTCPYEIELEEAHPTLGRHDLVVICMDNIGRGMGILVKTGVPGVQPATPEPEELDYVKEIPLAAVYISPNQENIAVENIKDRRYYATVDNMKNNVKRYTSKNAFFAAYSDELLSFPFYQKTGETIVESLEVNENKIIHIHLAPSIEVPKGSYLGIKILMPKEIGNIPSTAIVSFAGSAGVSLVIEQKDDMGRRFFVFTSTTDNARIESVKVSFMSSKNVEEKTY